MASNKKSTSNSNTNKGMKYSTKNSVIMGTTIAVLALAVIGYLVYISGFLTSVIPAVKIDQTTNGQTKTIAKVYTPELNYYRNQILSMYSMYGMSIDGEYLDAMNEEKGKTNGQLLYDQAAEQIMRTYLVNDYASKDPNFVTENMRYADYELYLFGLRAKNNNYPTVDQYLASVYGTGMSSRVYKDIIGRQTMSSEYEQYARQFVYMPDKASLQATYDADPSLYLNASFNSFFFSDSVYEDQALEMAQAVADGAISSTAFQTILLSQIGPEKAEILGLTLNGNETYVEGASRDTTAASKYPEGTTEFVFDPANVGKTTVIDTENGAFVIYLDKLELNETPTYSYRKIVLNNKAYDNVDVDEVLSNEKIDKGFADAQAKAESIKAGITDELSFVSACKKNTDEIEDIILAGYVDGITADAYPEETTVGDELTFANWLMAPERQHGDMLVIASEDRHTVTIYYFDECMPAWMDALAQKQVSEKIDEWSTNTLNVQGTVPNISYSVVEHLTYLAQ